LGVEKMTLGEARNSSHAKQRMLDVQNQTPPSKSLYKK